MWGDDWGMSEYPLVRGHEISGRIVKKGDGVTHLQLGQKVGFGWYSKSCQKCGQCFSGSQNLCAENESTILGLIRSFFLPGAATMHRKDGL